MIRVKNQKVVTKLSKRSLKANRVRNTVAVCAIALTSLLFTALFTILGTMISASQQQTFRQVGGNFHGGFKNLTLEEKEILEKDPMIREAGGRLMLGKASGENFRKVRAEVSYMDESYRKGSFCVPEHGSEPKEGTKEIACDTRVLQCLGIEPEIGAKVTLTFEIGGDEKAEITDTFVLSGWWEFDAAGSASMVILPKSYVEQALLEHPVNMDFYGMEEYPLSQLEVIDGDPNDLYDPEKNAIAAVYQADDYGNAIEGSHWAKTGDTVKVRYVYEWEYTDAATGEIITEEEIESYEKEITVREKEYRDVSYEVAACVIVKHAMSYRSYGGYPFVLNADVWQRDSRNADVMIYLFNTAKENQAQMQNFLEEYTTQVNPVLDFESKQSYMEEFSGFRNMFLIVGGSLSFVIGLVGILNFFNAILTSIYTRRREFAMLQSIGMTGRQLKQMLICEGLLYGISAIVVSTALSVLAGMLIGNAINSIFWFFTYRFTLLPVLPVIPIFVLLGVFLPLVNYRSVAKQTVVERLRMGE